MFGKEYGEVSMKVLVVIGAIALIVGFFFVKLVKFFSNPENYN